MKLFLLSQTEYRGYDTYDSCVVCAESVEDAVIIHPSAIYGIDFTPSCPNWDRTYPDWATHPDHVQAEYLGEAAPGVRRGIICASFNAG